MLVKKKRKVKRSIFSRMFPNNFTNDPDGLSAKDYLLLSSTGVFYIFVSVGLVRLLFDKGLDPTYLELLKMVSPVVMTVVGGVMGVQAVEVFVDGRQKPVGETTTLETKVETTKIQNTNEEVI